MDKNLQIPGLYIIRFQTAPAVPAPYAHYDTFKLYIDSDTRVKVDFSINYTDRDELTEDDILDEGFTMDDDYAWKGQLPQLWISEFSAIMKASKTIRRRDEKEFEDFVEVELEEDGKRVTIYPEDKGRWAYFVQELIQAIFEVSGKEKAFEMTLLEIADSGLVEMDLHASFAEKTFTVKKNGAATRKMEWNALQKMLDTIYKATFLEELAQSARPSKKGKYISAGDGMWYQLGTSVVETTQKSKDLPKVEAIFRDLQK